MKDRYMCIEKIQRIKCPLLMIHGERDSIIPIGIGRDLFDAAKAPKEGFPVPGADYNDLPWVGGRAYLEKIEAFLRHSVLCASGPVLPGTIRGNIECVFPALAQLVPHQATYSA